MQRSKPSPNSLTAVIVALAAALAVFASAIAPTPVAAQTQIKLTDQQITGFITAQRGLVAITEKLEKAGDTIDKQLQAELDAIAKKGGFASFDEFDGVRTNIMLILAGIDPTTGAFTEPIELVKKDIATIKADQSLPADEKMQTLKELEDSLKEMQPIKFKENILLVQKRYKEIDAALQ